MSNKNSSIPNSEINNYIVNESILNPVYSGSVEYNKIIEKISHDLADGKKVITVINGQLWEIEKSGDSIKQTKLP